MNSLAIQYKKTNDINIRNKLFNKILPYIKEKARYVYWYKSYKLYNKICKVKYLSSISEEDIFQELCIDVLLWIEKYNTKGKFKNYLFASFWNWRPKSINKETYMDLKSIKCSGLSSEQKDKFIDSLSKEVQFDVRIGVNNLLFFVKSPNEKAILKLLYINPDISRNDIAKILGISNGRVSQIFSKLKEKKKLYTFIKKDL